MTLFVPVFPCISFPEQQSLLAEPVDDAEGILRSVLDEYSREVEGADSGDLMATAMLRIQIVEKGITVQDRSSALSGVEVRHPAPEYPELPPTGMEPHWKAPGDARAPRNLVR